jgi:RimJ/RimL family protein N-acetyltransferase
MRLACHEGVRPGGLQSSGTLGAMSGHVTTVLRTDRLVLTPLEPGDASEMVGVLADVELYAFTGGEPPSLSQLAARYRAQVAGSASAGERWHNWIIRVADSNTAVGFVQATVVDDHADVAWMVGVGWQHHGIAREAATAMCQWLRGCGIRRITAHIHPDHDTSVGVAAACGLQLTDEVDGDGEQIWVSSYE